MQNVKVKIDEGVVLLVAEVLRVERKLQKRPYDDAANMIKVAALNLKATRGM